MSEFDFDAAFGENYLHFYVPLLNDEHNRAEVDEIIETLGLKPGDRVLDAPCGHGRISNLLASHGMIVTGVDQSALFLEKAASDAVAQGGVTCPSGRERRGVTMRSCAGSPRSATSTTRATERC